MSEEISIQDANGQRISGRYVVRDGIVTVTAAVAAQRGGRSKTVCSAPRPSQRRFCFNCIRRGDRPVEPRRIAANIAKLPELVRRNA
jgi:hypothetical protein